MRQCAGICSILSYVRFIGVGFCRQGADHATTIGGAPAWFRMSGLAHYTFDSTALECPHPYDVTRLTLEYFQVSRTFLYNCRASKFEDNPLNLSSGSSMESILLKSLVQSLIRFCCFTSAFAFIILESNQKRHSSDGFQAQIRQRR